MLCRTVISITPITAFGSNRLGPLLVVPLEPATVGGFAPVYRFADLRTPNKPRSMQELKSPLRCKLES
jgi:hypothetical protein